MPSPRDRGAYNVWAWPFVRLFPGITARCFPEVGIVFAEWFISPHLRQC